MSIWHTMVVPSRIFWWGIDRGAACLARDCILDLDFVRRFCKLPQLYILSLKLLTLVTPTFLDHGSAGERLLGDTRSFEDCIFVRQPKTKGTSWRHPGRGLGIVKSGRREITRARGPGTPLTIGWRYDGDAKLHYIPGAVEQVYEKSTQLGLIRRSASPSGMATKTLPCPASGSKVPTSPHPPMNIHSLRTASTHPPPTVLTGPYTRPHVLYHPRACVLCHFLCDHVRRLSRKRSGNLRIPNGNLHPRSLETRSHPQPSTITYVPLWVSSTRIVAYTNIGKRDDRRMCSRSR